MLTAAERLPGWWYRTQVVLGDVYMSPRSGFTAKDKLVSV